MDPLEGDLVFTGEYDGFSSRPKGSEAATRGEIH